MVTDEGIRRQQGFRVSGLLTGITGIVDKRLRMRLELLRNNGIGNHVCSPWI